MGSPKVSPGAQVNEMAFSRFSAQVLVLIFVAKMNTNLPLSPFKMCSRDGEVLIRASAALALNSAFDLPVQMRSRLPIEVRQKILVSDVLVWCGGAPLLMQINAHSGIVGQPERIPFGKAGCVVIVERRM